jgi:nicotinamide mononucleotide adenylyltransferase
MNSKHRMFDHEDIIFAAVDPKYKSRAVEGFLHFFPSDEELRLWRLQRKKKNVIYLNELPDPKCKTCYGTAKAGTRKHPLPKSVNEIKDQFIILFRQLENVEDHKEIIDRFTQNLLIALKFPETFAKPIGILVELARKETQYKDVYEVSKKYAEQIKKDFEPEEVLWCHCFQKELNKQITQIKREQKFSTN